MTKEEHIERNKRWYEKHKNDPEYKARRDATTKRWIKNNRDRWNAYQRAYRKARKEGTKV
jgi:hypothetical protein